MITLQQQKTNLQEELKMLRANQSPEKLKHGLGGRMQVHQRQYSYLHQTVWKSNFQSWTNRWHEMYQKFPQKRKKGRKEKDWNLNCFLNIIDYISNDWDMMKKNYDLKCELTQLHVEVSGSQQFKAKLENEKKERERRMQQWRKMYFMVKTSNNPNLFWANLQLEQKSALEDKPVSMNPKTKTCSEEASESYWKEESPAEIQKYSHSEMLYSLLMTHLWMDTCSAIALP